MFFASDNTGPVHPKVMEALSRANEGYVPSYGADALMEAVTAQIRELFEAPEAAVYLVATGTAANVLSLATFTQPYQTVFCSPVAHIHEDECNAPEFFTSGAKLTLVPAKEGKMTGHGLRDTIEGEETRGVHGPARGPVSITNVTERGTLYTLDELQALTAIAKAYDLPVHLDGARFANAVSALGCTPAEMTWRAGVDVVSFGGTKNGLMGVEAVILFDPAKAQEFEYRRKRGAQLFSKHRYLSAQMLAYLEDGLWLDLAAKANAANAKLARGLKQIETTRYMHEPEANMSFMRLPRAAHARAFAAGASYYLQEGPLEGADGEALLGARLVCDWSTSDENIETFLSHIRG